MSAYVAAIDGVGQIVCPRCTERIATSGEITRQYMKRTWVPVTAHELREGSFREIIEDSWRDHYPDLADLDPDLVVDLLAAAFCYRCGTRVDAEVIA